ncbi:MAG: hypothetical protein Q7K43_04410, partial [Candidatus Woesearchaeota archaeon]|nr:hypothetical protein [Candidatus Woesearchaeota archaeon]
MIQSEKKDVFLELMVNDVFVGPGAVGTVSQIFPAYNRMVNVLQERGYSVFADPSHLIFDMPIRMLVGGKVE